MIHTHELISNLADYCKEISTTRPSPNTPREDVLAAEILKDSYLYYIDHLQRAVQFRCEIDEYVDDWDDIKRHGNPDGLSALRLPYPLMYVEMYPKGGLLLMQDEGSTTIYGYPFFNFRKTGWNALIPTQLKIDTVSRKYVGSIGQLPVLNSDQVGILVGQFRKNFSDPVAVKGIQNGVATLVMVLRYVLDVLNCNNVGLEDNHPPEKIAKKRAKLGREPLFSYKTLTIIAPKKPKNKNDDDNAGDDAASMSGVASDRTSPRLHLRRGHIRRLSPERTTWVTSCMVGTSGNGAVAKDYKITTQQRREQ